MKTPGQINYEGFSAATGGVSSVSNLPLPTWDNQTARVRACWEMAARAVLDAEREAATGPTFDALMVDECIEAIKQCERILEACEQILEQGEEFAQSVSEKVASIRDWVDTNGAVTKGQKMSLDNMESGVKRWIQ